MNIHPDANQTSATDSEFTTLNINKDEANMLY